MIRLLRAADRKTMPWKNGGGTTTEIAVSPAGAGLEDFDWRLSMARVEAGGPFSVFPGIDRSLAVLEGEGIILTVADRIPIGLLKTSDPLPFPADAPTSCALINGPILDLNVMVRRGAYVAKVRRLEIGDDVVLSPVSGWALVFVNKGNAILHRDGATMPLGEKDCVLAESPDHPATVKPRGQAELFLIEVSAEPRAHL